MKANGFYVLIQNGEVLMWRFSGLRSGESGKVPNEARCTEHGTPNKMWQAKMLDDATNYSYLQTLWKTEHLLLTWYIFTVLFFGKSWYGHTIFNTSEKKGKNKDQHNNASIFWVAYKVTNNTFIIYFQLDFHTLCLNIHLSFYVYFILFPFISLNLLNLTTFSGS